LAKPLNLNDLASALDEAGRPWEHDTTSLTLLTEEERRIRLGFVPPPGEPTLEEAAARFEALEQQGGLDAIEASDTIGAPAKYDLRDVNGTNYTTPVKNQGGCGSCVAFGTAAVLETTYRRGHGTGAIDLSEGHLFYCHAASEGRNCGNGWWPENAIKKARDIGVTTEDHFPYTAGDQSCGLQGAWQSDLAKATGYQKLSTRAEMKQWISTKGSITGCFLVYQDFFNYRSGVYRHVTGALAGGHCVEIVGYDDSQGCWICKNSWGSNWGEGGYFRIAYGQCNIESYSGPWGVSSVTLLVWRRDVRVKGLWSNSSAKNAWAYLDGVGWRRLATGSEVQNHSRLAMVGAATAANRAVDVHDDNGTLQTVYA
jgi:C1A family cysteine protease